ncbi:MAG: ribonuclease P protein component [Planctomycetota bacterium]|nr:MAG: ribonuclease P protein component [Planctomycetota bacterium]
MVTPTRLGLPPAARLRRPSEFERVYGFRRSAADGSIVVYACPAAVVDGATAAERAVRVRLGLSVSRRVGNAVVRNGWKRRLREAFRLMQGRLPPGQDYIVVVRPGKMPEGERGARAVEETLLSLAERIVSRSGYRTASVPAVGYRQPRRR